MKTDLKTYLEQAKLAIDSCSVADAVSLLDQRDVLFVDVRNPKELETDGKIPGALNISRGMLEFAIEVGSPYHESLLHSGKRLIFYCKSGGRSVLAAKRARDMGLANINNLEGGIIEWKKLSGPIAD